MNTRKHSPIWSAWIALVIAALACNVRGEVPTETPTTTPEAATATAATASPLAQQCIGTANRDANMRTGPGTDWEIIGQITAGNAAPITGHNGSKTWWQINGNAWVSAELLTTSGDCNGVLVAAYPPAPTKKANNNSSSSSSSSSQSQATQAPAGTFVFPIFTLVLADNVAFEIDYNTSWNCGSSPRISFIIYNQGNVNIQSLYYSVEAPTGVYINSGTVNNTPFKNSATEGTPGCTQAGADSLAPGQGKYVPIVISNNPGGEGFLYIEACSQNNRSGTCESQILFFDF